MTEELTIVKIGGKIIDNESELASTLREFSAISGNKILVHGGGRSASKMLEKLGIEAKMIEGRRITDEATLEVVVMVYAGLINKNIVSKLQALGVDAMGLTGADGNVIQAHKREMVDIDYGYAGDIDTVNVKQITDLLNNQNVPVFAPITHDGNGLLLNTNADTMASSIGRALAQKFKVRLAYLFDAPGVYKDLEKKEVFNEITEADFQKYRDTDLLSDGILPKLENAFEALKEGIDEIVLCGIGQLGQIGQQSFTGTTIR